MQSETSVRYPLPATPASVADADARADALIARMTPEEKVDQLAGIGKEGDAFGDQNAEIFATPGNERLGIPRLVMGHAITGVRSGRVSRIQGTYFSTPVGIAATWDPALYARVGAALAVEMRALGQDLNLGPTLNLIRHPLGGRNWESFSEDPVLTAALAVPFIRALQDGGLIAGPKHFAANNQEHQRFDINNVIDERTLRELYLHAFRAAVVEGGALNVMAAYNRINGTYVCELPWLLRGVLREEWGFAGFVVSDFGKAVQSTVGAVRAGVSVEMDAPSHYGPKMLEALRRGDLAEAEVDALLREKLRTMFLIGLFDGRPRPDASAVHTEAHQALALEVARSAPILLKNEGGLLPLDRRSVRTLAVIGPNAARPSSMAGAGNGYALYLQGGGSGRSYYRREALVEPLTGLAQVAGGDVEVVHARGCPPPDGATARDAAEEARLLEEAVALARRADAVVLVGGLSGFLESEGFDRTDARLPEAQVRLIEAVLAVQPRTVVALAAGSYLDVSAWIDRAPAVLFCPYAGEKLGLGLAEVVWGEVCPSGRLPFSYPRTVDAYPPGAIYTGGPHSQTGGDNVYAEGLFVGYRHFDTRGVDLLYPFGHGLSYTTFSYRNLRVDRPDSAPGEPVTVSLEVENTGARAGAEVVQLYVRDEACSEPRPRHELKAFARIPLQPRERRTVSWTLGEEAFRFYSAARRTWVVEPGDFVLEVGASSRDLRAEVVVRKRAEN